MKLAKVEKDKLYVVQERTGLYGRVWRSVAVFDNEKDMLQAYPNMERKTVRHWDDSEGLRYADNGYARICNWKYERMRRCEVYDRQYGKWKKDTAQSA